MMLRQCESGGHILEAEKLIRQQRKRWVFEIVKIDVRIEVIPHWRCDAVRITSVREIEQKKILRRSLDHELPSKLLVRCCVEHYRLCD